MTRPFPRHLIFTLMVTVLTLFVVGWGAADLNKWTRISHHDSIHYHLPIGSGEMIKQGEKDFTGEVICSGETSFLVIWVAQFLL